MKTMRNAAILTSLLLVITLAQAQGQILYVVAAEFGGAVFEMTTNINDPGPPNGFGSGILEYPRGIAVDASGVVYVGNGGDTGATLIRKFSPSGADLGVFTPLPGSPRGFHFEQSGSLLAIAGANIYRISPDGSTTTLLVSTILSVVDITTDATGNIYATIDRPTNNILKFASNGAPLGVFASLVNAHLTGLVFDKDGNMLVSNYSGEYIEKLSSTGQDLGVFSTNVFNPWGLVFDPSGNLYVADEPGVHKLSPTGDVLAYGASYVHTPREIALGSVPEPGLTALIASFSLAALFCGAKKWRSYKQC
jgi:streptogramin lyase